MFLVHLPTDKIRFLSADVVSHKIKKKKENKNLEYSETEVNLNRPSTSYRGRREKKERWGKGSPKFEASEKRVGTE